MSSNCCALLVVVPPSLRLQNSNSARPTEATRLLVRMNKKIIVQCSTSNQIIVDDCQKRKQLPLRRQVTFAETATVRYHLHVNDISVEEIRATWMDISEMKSIKRDAIQTLRTMKQDTSFEDEEFCGRGLEYLVDPQWTLRRNRGIEVVMKAQKALQHLDDPNPAMMAQVYCMVTAESRSFAYAKGLSDHEAARN